MKILAACQAGVCRSAAMARELKQHGHDVLVVGLGYNDPETVKMLVDWADKVVVLQKELLKLVPPEGRDKVVIADVGPDVWDGAYDPDLQNRVKVIVEAWKKADWNLESFTLRPKLTRSIPS
jgi:hypothetical protein